MNALVREAYIALLCVALLLVLPGTVISSAQISEEQLEARISALILVGISEEPYLLTVDGFAESVSYVWRSFTDWARRTDLTDRYEELYSLGFEYAGLAYTVLLDARKAIRNGDVDQAEKLYRRYEAYSRASRAAYDGAIAVFEGQTEVAIQIAKGIQDGCEAAVRAGVSIMFPSAAPIVDNIYRSFDFVIDSYMYGVEEAGKELAVDLIVNKLFNGIKLEGRTLAESLGNRIGKEAYPIISAYLANGQAQWAVYSILKEQGVTLAEGVVEDLMRDVVDKVLNAANREVVTNASMLPAPTVTLNLRIVSADGKPIPNAIVQWQDLLPLPQTAVTNSDGAVVLSGRPGTWRFTAWQYGFEAHSWRLSVESGMEYEVALISTSVLSVGSPSIVTTQVTGTDPVRPVAHPDRQWLTINGTDFVPESQVILRIGTGVHQIPADRTQFVNSSRIRVFAGLTDSGTWTAQVVNPGNLQSNRFSFVVEAAATPDPTPLPPSNLKVEGRGLTPDGVRHHLTWDHNSDNEVGFRIERMWRLMPFFFPDEYVPIGWCRVDEVGPDVRTYTTVLPIWIGYEPVYRVAAIFANGRLSEWSNIATLAALLIARPTELQAEISGPPLRVKLSWKDRSNNELGFRIFRWTGIGEGPWLEQPDTPWPLLGTVDAGVEIFTDTKVKPGYTHRYFVIAFNDNEASLQSNVETVFISNQSNGPPQNPTPQVTGTAPTRPVADPDRQWLTINGTDFVPESQVTLRIGAGVHQIPADRTQFVSSFRIRVLAGLTDSGTWTAQVINPGNLQSNRFSFTVEAAATPDPTPQVTGTAPTRPVADPDRQWLTINGTDFVPESQVTLRIGAGVHQIPADRTQFVSSFRIRVLAGLTDSGTWTAQVINPGNLQSNRFSFTVEAAATPDPTPQVTGTAPTRPVADPDRQWLTINGTDFVPESQVTLRIGAGVHQIPADRTQFVSSFRIRVLAGLTDSGTWTAQVINPGNLQSNRFSFTVEAAATPDPTPQVTGTAPTRPVADPDRQWLTINGTDFVPESQVTLRIGAGVHQIPADRTQFVSSFRIRVLAGLTDSGTWTAQVINPGNLQSNRFSFTVEAAATPDPTPQVTGTAPTRPVADPDRQWLTINGTDFVPESQVTLRIGAGVHQIPADRTQFVSSFRIRVLAGLTDSGTWTAQVINPGNLQSNRFSFTVEAAATPDPTPQVTGTAPTRPVADPDRQWLTINGTDFVPESQVTLRIGAGVHHIPADRTQFVSSFRIRVLAGLTDSGTWTAQVINPGNLQSNRFSFTVEAAATPDPTPQVTGTAPTRPVADPDRQWLTINGTDFVPESQVTLRIGAGVHHIPADRTQFVSSFRIRVLAGLTDSGTWTAQVINPGNLQSNRFSFTVEAAATPDPTPQVTGTAPTRPVADPDRQWLTINGTDFVPESQVTLRIGAGVHHIPADRTQFVSSFRIRVLAGLTDSGTWTAQVINPGNLQSNRFSFTVEAAATPDPTPQVTGTAPTRPVADPDRQWLTINGTDFVPESQVTLRIGAGVHQIPADRTQFVSSSRIRVNAGLTDSGTWTAQVINPGNLQSNRFSFVVEAAATPDPTPQVTGTAPTRPVADPDRQWLTINGTDFVPESQVTLRIGAGVHQIPASRTEFVSSFRIRVLAGLTDSGTWTAQVINPGNLQSNRFSFTVEAAATPDPTPQVTGTAPTRPVADPDRQWLTINGTDFVPESQVTLRIGAGVHQIPASRTEFVSSFRIRVLAGLTDSGTWTAQVINPGNLQSNRFSFTVVP